MVSETVVILMVEDENCLLFEVCARRHEVFGRGTRSVRVIVRDRSMV